MKGFTVSCHWQDMLNLNETVEQDVASVQSDLLAPTLYILPNTLIKMIRSDFVLVPYTLIFPAKL